MNFRFLSGNSENMQMTAVKEESNGSHDHCGIKFDLLVHENIIDTEENRTLTIHENVQALAY